jgi:choline-sulfatase
MDRHRRVIRPWRALSWLWMLALAIVIRPETAPHRVHAERPGNGPVSGPNVLILIADDHRGGTLGIDGDPHGVTPRLDRLAREGVRFDRAYCNAPVCTASRQSLITGRLPHALGVTQLASRLPDDAVTLGDWLGDFGYATAAYGKMHFNGPSRHGFAERLDVSDWQRHLKKHPPAGGYHPPRWRPFEDRASEWLNAACRSAGLPAGSMESAYFADRAIEYLKRRHDRPFALVVSLYDPHAPFKFPDDWRGRQRPLEFSAPTLSDADRKAQPRVFRSLKPADYRGIQAAYYTSLSFVDHEMGRVLDALETSGQAANTIVVYLGDNGYLLGEHGRFEKHCFYEPAVRVPLIVRWPGHLREDQQCRELVELVDLVPTLLDLLELPPPPDLHGTSLVPLLRGDPGASGREVVFGEYLENEEAMVRSGRYKLIVGTGKRRRQDGYSDGRPLPGPFERLYDLEADPGETTDVQSRPDLAPIKDALRHRLYERLVTTREGIAPVPAGLSETEAIHWCLIPRDAIHAREGTR